MPATTADQASGLSLSMVWLSRSRSNQQPRRPLRPIWPKAISQPSRTNPSASLLSPSTHPHAASLFLPRSHPRALDLLLPLDHPVPPHPLPRSHPPRRPLLASRRLSPLSSWRRCTERGPLPRPCRTPDPERRALKGPAFAPPSSMAVADRARSSRRCTSSRLCCLLAAGHPSCRPGFPCTSSLTPDLRPPPPRCPLAPCRPIWPRRPGSPWCYLAASSSAQVHLAASAVLAPLLLPWHCCHPWQLCRCLLTTAVQRNTCRRWPEPRSPAPLLRVLVSCGHRPCIMPSTCTVP